MLQITRLSKIIQNVRPYQVVFRTIKSQPTKQPPRLDFKVGGLKKTGGESSWDSWLITLEGRQQMARWVGFGGTVVVMIGKLVNYSNNMQISRFNAC